MFLVQLVDNIGPVTSGSHATQPSVRKLGEPRSGNGSYSTGIDHIWYQMNCQTDQCRSKEAGRPGDVVEAKR